MNINTDLLFKCSIGLEKESLRIDENGRLAQTPHPFLGNPYIERDFCENQVELITQPAASADDAYRDMQALDEYVCTALKERREYLWRFSNPPYFENDSEILVARFSSELKGKEVYRHYLAEKYGKRKMLFSGIHYNFSFDDALLKALFEESGETDFNRFKDTIYLNLAERVTEYSWLIVYLTAASPVFDKSYFHNETEAEAQKNKYASARCSEIGYWNTFIPLYDFSGLQAYVNSIEKYIRSGELSAASELYYPVRLKPRGSNRLDTLSENGVNHIELRMLDLNPLSPIGVFKEDIAFLHILLIYLSFQEKQCLDDDAQKTAISNMKRAALYDDKNTTVILEGRSVPVTDAALAVLEDIKVFFEDKSLYAYEGVLDYQEDKIRRPENRYAYKIRKQFADDFTAKGVRLSKKI